MSTPFLEVPALWPITFKDSGSEPHVFNADGVVVFPERKVSSLLSNREVQKQDLENDGNSQWSRSTRPHNRNDPPLSNLVLVRAATKSYFAIVWRFIFRHDPWI